MKQLHELFDWVGAPILLLLFILLFFLESRFELRKRNGHRVRRFFLNNFLSFPGFLVLRFLFLPAMVWLALRNTEWRIGFSYLVDWNIWIEGLLVILILDYATYVWHIINHRIPFLWRFHLVHHVDVDLDVTTAIRFHFGELIGSIFFRGLFVLLSGASIVHVIVFEILFEAATLFHHANVKLHFPLERVINFLFVTPRMHGIHHSDVEDELDSNYGVIFSFWDRIHGTAHLDIPQRNVNIGVPAFRDGEQQTVKMLLQLPFRKLPSTGLKHRRQHSKKSSDQHLAE